jgi:glutaredoxin 3
MRILIEIYTKFGCPYCSRARQLLTNKAAEFIEHDISFGGPKSDEMNQRVPNARTVPQIFIGETHVGGCDELMALEHTGKLDPMLAALGSQ